jgi:hypothetical protein
MRSPLAFLEASQPGHGVSQDCKPSPEVEEPRDPGVSSLQGVGSTVLDHPRRIATFIVSAAREPGKPHMPCGEAVRMISLVLNRDDSRGARMPVRLYVAAVIAIIVGLALALGLGSGDGKGKILYGIGFIVIGTIILGFGLWRRRR